MKKMNFKAALLALAVPAVLASCAREADTPEKPKDVTAGHTVTITAGLPAETRVAHEYSNSQIKPLWQEGDEVLVSYMLDGVEKVEVFTLNSGAGTRSASFSNAESSLGEDMPFSVHYPANENGWADQDGTVEHLPESLSGTGENITAPVTLVPALTYFHVIVTIPEEMSFAHAYLNKLEGQFTMYSAPGVKGAVTVTPTGGFAAGDHDFFIAVMLDGNTAGNATDVFGENVSPKFQVVFGGDKQGVSLDGQCFSISGDNYKFNWSPTKAYEAGKVYKVANKTFVATSAAQSMPR